MNKIKLLKIKHILKNKSHDQILNQSNRKLGEQRISAVKDIPGKLQKIKTQKPTERGNLKEQLKDVRGKIIRSNRYLVKFQKKREIIKKIRR